MILSARFVGNGGTSFCSFASSAITSGVKTSTRVESSWPILMKVGPSLISVSRSSAARLARAFTSASPSRPRPRSRATLSAWPMQLVQMYTERFTTHQLRRSGFFGARGACSDRRSYQRPFLMLCTCLPQRVQWVRQLPLSHRAWRW